MPGDVHTHGPLTWGGVTLDLDRRVLRGPDGESALTAMEHAALAYLASHLGEVVERTALERDVWGFTAGTRSETVPVTLRRLRARMEPDPKNPRALQTLRGVGWRLDPPDPTPAPPVTGGLPRVRTPFRDRPEELRAIGDLLGAGWRVVTLVGPGGIGKTRLAGELAQRTAASAWASVGTARDEAGVRAAVRNALDANADDRSTLERALDARRPALLVLDEAEGAREAVADVVAWLAPRVPVVVTSRTPLALDGEAVHEVPPLATADAVAFLADRIAASRWRRDVGPEVLERVVHALDGVPLALEVAAGRPQELDSLAEALQAGPVVLPTMDRAIERSWQALDPEARSLLQALSLFGETASSDELRDWLGPDADPASLADASLAVWDDGRWRVLRTTRSFVRRTEADWDGLRASFQGWLVRRAEAHYDPLLRASRATLRDAIALSSDMEAVVREGPPDVAAAMAAHLVPLHTIRGGERLPDLLRAGLARGSHPLLHAHAAYHLDDGRTDEHLAIARSSGHRGARIQAMFVDIWSGRRPPREDVVALTQTSPGSTMPGPEAGLWTAWVHGFPERHPDQEAMRVSNAPFPYLAATLEDRLCTLAWHAGDPAAAYGHARAARATSERGITPLERVRGRIPLLLLLAIDRPEEALVEVDEALGITVPVGEVRWTHLLRLVRVGVLYTLQRDGDARAALTAVAGRAHTPQVRERHDLLRALLGVPVELPEGLEPWAEAGRLRDAVLRDEPGAREALVRHIDALGRPPRLFLASLEAAWRRLI